MPSLEFFTMEINLEVSGLDIAIIDVVGPLAVAWFTGSKVWASALSWLGMRIILRLL